MHTERFFSSQTSCVDFPNCNLSSREVEDVETILQEDETEQAVPIDICFAVRDLAEAGSRSLDFSPI